jgi:hypothetical protein
MVECSMHGTLTPLPPYILAELLYAHNWKEDLPVAASYIQWKN